MGRLDGKVAIITGSGQGIGQACAYLFAKEGAAIVVADLAEDAGKATVEAIRGRGGKAEFAKVDVSKASEVEAMVAVAEKAFGRLDILVNNAGISHPKDGDEQETTEAVWDVTQAVNVKGVFFGCKYAIPLMKKTGGGRASIVNIASFVARMGAATPQIAYTASKGAVLAMTRELACIYAREGVRVNALSPGPLNTPLLQKYLDTEEKRQKRLVHVPLGRFGEPHEIANAALFLASDESSFMTGSEFLCDGGITAAYVTPVGDPIPAPAAPKFD